MDISDKFNQLEEKTFLEVMPSTPLAEYAWDDINKSRNRQLNITPSLSTVVQPYMNANIIKIKGTFQIASQAPLPIEFYRFYSTVLSNEITKIFQLCDYEDQKCDQYIPNHNSTLIFIDQDNGDDSIIVKSTQLISPFEDIVITQLQVQEQIIIHYRLLSFPDMKVPLNNDSFEFLLNQASAEKILVHCSAGVGRTGVFIVSRIKYLLKNVILDDIILELRRQRSLFMVQTQEQYQFCYQFCSENSTDLEQLEWDQSL